MPSTGRKRSTTGGFTRPANRSSLTSSGTNAAPGASSATVRDDNTARRRPTWFRNSRATVSAETTKTQAVEIWSGNHKPKYLFSPITDSFGKNVETEAIACKKTSKNVVRQGEPFHITIEGFYATPLDFSFTPGTELFMYSVEYNANDPALMKNIYDYRAQMSTGTNSDGGSPYVFTTVPSPGNLMVTYDGTKDGSKPLTHLDVHLRLAEVTDTIRTRRLLNDVTKLNSQIVPQFAIADKDVLTEILDVVGNLSQGIIDEVSNPDNIFCADTSFKIPPANAEPNPELDSYLRYGVYYFLRKPSRAKLYAQTSTLQNARLMVKMVDDPARTNGSARPEFAEFAETTYISMRVHRGADDSVTYAGAPSKVVTLNSLYSRFPQGPRYIPK